MYKIGVFSKMNRVSIKTLRHYDELGLLHPAYVEEFTGYRYYSADQMPRLHQILVLKEVGLSLQEIKQALEPSATNEQMVALLENKRSEVLQTLIAEQQKIRRIQHHLTMLQKEDNCMNNVIIKALPEVIVASLRRTVANYEAFNSLYPEMGAYMTSQKVKCAEPAYCFTLFHDGEYKDQDIDVEICEAVTEYGKDSQQIKFKKIDAVETAACILHQGSYETIGISYGALFKWIEGNGYDVTGLPRESYIDGIWNKNDPDEWLTEVQIPVTPGEK
ncbi:DNA-binding transcriptional MerR regulator [Fontibacillus phaseoli]|uniref:DNA-binding transcriptional MerR regulator n=1 Tax=Fontibacillus phaseoli TaxID=1416533 RepID=A0A369BTA0_9BACL|nr:MerR family transcriptional regulator [Fontibacillus phaseoli]RCX22834.1 DNA-binding transcriptional MerR regulator [Fontibacillus phaseoli]